MPDLFVAQATSFWRWNPRQEKVEAMRMDLLAALRAGEAVDPIVRATAPHIRLPHETTEGVKPVDPLSHQE